MGESNASLFTNYVIFKARSLILIFYASDQILINTTFKVCENFILKKVKIRDESFCVDVDKKAYGLENENIEEIRGLQSHYKM